MPVITDPPLEVLPSSRMLIGASTDVAPTCEGVPHRYAATGTETATVPFARPEDVDAAVDRAAEAAIVWRNLPCERRRDLLLSFADRLRDDDDRLSAISVIDSAIKARGFGRLCAETLAYNAGWVDKLGGEIVTSYVGRGFDYTVPEPYGVVAVIIPWNAPALTMTSVIAPALAAGNAVVVKASELAPFAALRIGELALEAGLPPGVVNVLAGDGQVGRCLTGHPGVQKIHFTGSTPAGRDVLAHAATNLTPVGLELGGKSGNLVFDDADLDVAAKLAVAAATGLNGQVCTAGARILAHAGIYDELVDRIGTLMGRVVVGDPADEATTVGPVITDAAAVRIVGMIERAADSGARVVVGGRRMDGEYARGNFVEPTLVADVDPQSEIAQNEIFGPAISVTRFEDEDEAVEIANGTRYGLAAYVQTHDADRAHRLAASLQAGMIYVNGGLRAHPPSAPFGGVKGSGFGRLGGRVGIEEFVHHKNVWMNT